MTNNIKVAQLGKTVGLRGDLKLYDFSDFPSQFKNGTTFFTDKKIELTVSSFDSKKILIRFKDFEDIDLAKKLVNSFLLTNIKDSRKNCKLNKDEYFWFDIKGCQMVENEELLGEVFDIERIGDIDFLHVKSSENLEEKKEFLIPYQDRYIIFVDIKNKIITTRHSKELYESL